MSQTWITKTISEETKIPDLENKLSVVIKPSKAIAKGDTVTIKGLSGTATNDNNSIDIDQPSSPPLVSATIVPQPTSLQYGPNS